jgi:hypothetical protein
VADLVAALAAADGPVRAVGSPSDDDVVVPGAGAAASLPPAPPWLPPPRPAERVPSPPLCAAVEAAPIPRPAPAIAWYRRYRRTAESSEPRRAQRVAYTRTPGGGWAQVSPKRSSARPPIGTEPAIIGLSRISRGRLGSRLFALFFVLVFTVIAIQLVLALLKL